MEKQRDGFTLIELVVVMGIMVLVTGVGIVSLVSRKGTTDLTDATKGVAGLLRQAQADSMQNKNGAIWGVHFANATNTAPFYVLFSSSYSTATTAGYYRLPASVGYSAASLPQGSSIDLTFAAITGTASASTSINLYLFTKPSVSSTIKIASSGAIAF